MADDLRNLASEQAQATRFRQMGLREVTPKGGTTGRTKTVQDAILSDEPSLSDLAAIVPVEPGAPGENTGAENATAAAPEGSISSGDMLGAAGKGALSGAVLGAPAGLPGMVAGAMAGAVQGILGKGVISVLAWGKNAIAGSTGPSPGDLGAQSMESPHAIAQAQADLADAEEPGTGMSVPDPGEAEGMSLDPSADIGGWGALAAEAQGGGAGGGDGK